MIVIMYHYVRPISGSKYPNIKGLELSEFKHQISYLKKNKKIIGLDEFSYLSSKGETGNEYVLLTFDDGYADIYDHVFPVLDKEKISGVFFVPANIIDKKGLLDVNLIHYLLSQKDEIVEQYIAYIKTWIRKNKDLYKLESFENYTDKIDLTRYRYDRAEIIIFKRLLQNELPIEARSLIIDELIEKYMSTDKTTLHDEWYANEDQLNCMIRNGMSVGGHGKTHQWLNNMSEALQLDEIKGSKSFLERLEPQNLLTFAYPYGGYNETSIKILTRLNFKFSFTTKPFHYDNTVNQNMEIPRLDANDFPKK